MPKPGFDIEKESSRIARNQSSRAVFLVLEKQKEDARAKQSDRYWGQGSNNVGDAIYRAVHRVEAALQGLDQALITLGELRDLIEAVRVENQNDPDDEHGFGSATYHGILEAIDAMIRRVGPSRTFSPQNAVSGDMEM